MAEWFLPTPADMSDYRDDVTTTSFDRLLGNNDSELMLVPGLVDVTDEMGPKRDPLYIVVPITVIYAIIFFTGVIGNVSTCIVIARNKSMHTATNYYLFSLSVSDLLLLVSGLPQEMYSIWSRYPYVFGEVFCVLRGLFAETSANATVLTITAFTVERYVAICHPFLSHTMSKLSRAVKLILLVWVVALAFAIPQALQFGVIQHPRDMELCVVKRIILEHSFEVSTFLFFVTPMTLITVLYALIGLRLRTSSLMKRDSGSRRTRGAQPSGTNCRHQNGQSSRRVLKMLVAVVVAFFICWAPFHAQRLVAIYGTIENHQPSTPIMLQIYAVMTYTSGILYYLSTTINPLLYNIMSNKFREAFKETLARCCGLQGRHAQRSYSVLSRSQLRAGQLGAAQDSTDYSGNSVRDDSVHSSATQKQTLESVKPPKKIYRKKEAGRDTSDSEFSNSSLSNNSQCCEANMLNGSVTTIKYKKKREMRVSLMPNCTDLDKATSLEIHDNKRIHVFDSNALRVAAHPKPKAAIFWKIFHGIALKSLDDGKRLSTCYSPPLGPKFSPEDGEPINETGEEFDMTPGKFNNFSNTSLRDANQPPGVSFQDELTTYMQELQQRERR